MPHLVQTHMCTHIHLSVYPRGLVGGCPPRSTSGVIASAQIEYISYVFITTARYVVPLSAAHPRSAARTPPPLPTDRNEEGWRWSQRRGGRSEEGKRRTRNLGAGMREKEMRQGSERRAAVGIAVARWKEEGEAGEYEGVATGNQA